MVDTSRLFQHGTLALLVPGLFEGTMKVGELLKHGDTGIGTTNALGGEMIILDGVAYLVTSDGKVREVNKNETTPFANAHFYQAKDKFTLQKCKFADFEQKLATAYDYHNLFVGIKITGDFKNVKTRSVKEQAKPYPTLVDVAKDQVVFEKAASKGTIVGYYSPTLFHGMTASGYHLHYLDSTLSMGGHVLDFEIEDAVVELQPFETVEQHFPVDSSAFKREKFDLKQVHAGITEAEK